MADPPAAPTNEELLAGARRSLATALDTGKSVTFNGRTYTSHDLADLREMIASLEAVTLEGGTGAVWYRAPAYCKGV
jgi:hypothetical protein